MTSSAAPLPWRVAMDRALYGPDGFFVTGAGPAAHFRTSVHASPVFAEALFRLLTRVDAALDHPARLDVVDVGAGRGELLHALLTLAATPTTQTAPDPATSAARPTASAATPPTGTSPAPLAHRIRLTAVERAPRPPALPPQIDWRDEIPDRITGLLLATEWLDNVPLDLAVPLDNTWHYLLVDPTTGTESLGPPATPDDAAWLTHWWPIPSTPPTEELIKKFASAGGPESDANFLINSGEKGAGEGGAGAGAGWVGGVRGEVGSGRDGAWVGAVRKVERGVAVAVDYGHLRDGRPVGGSLTGYRGGRQVPPVPDGSCDVTAHVAMDSVASAGGRVAGCAYTLVSQREALLALGADGRRPAIGLAGSDPAGYVRALAAASTVAELTDPAGLGGHWWLLQPVGVDLDPLVAR